MIGSGEWLSVPRGSAQGRDSFSPRITRVRGILYRRTDVNTITRCHRSHIFPLSFRKIFSSVPCSDPSRLLDGRYNSRYVMTPSVKKLIRPLFRPRTDHPDPAIEVDTHTPDTAGSSSDPLHYLCDTPSPVLEMDHPGMSRQTGREPEPLICHEVPSSSSAIMYRTTIVRG